MNKPEVLAPVGNFDMLYAGIASGADAFYLALDDFGARAYAENFTLANIGEVLDYVHLFGRKVFITMNTLLKDDEIERAVSYVEKLYELGVDGLIIQDLGFFNIIKDQVPGLDLHASTQMAVRDYFGAKYLMDIGFKRVVIARETPIEEIRKIASLDVETEVFVHGSLCVSYSGECLMSSYFGARSANRGRCAGPCRQKYELISDGKVLADDYFLNMKDLNVIDNLDVLLDIGVDCLKIEGRMKTPEYVFTSVKNYKSKIDYDIYSRDELIDSTNRGYTEGFIFHQNRDNVTLKDDNKHRSLGKVASNGKGKYFVTDSDLTIGDNLEITTDKNKKLPFTTTKTYKANDKIILDKYKDAQVGSDVYLLNSNKIKNNLIHGLETYKAIPVELEFKARLNDYPQVLIKHGNKEAIYRHDILTEKAQNISLSPEDVRDNLSKFNDEIFEPVSIDVDIDDGLFIRKKDINECRRVAISKLKEEILKDYHRPEVTIEIPDLQSFKKEIAEENVELLTNDISPDLLRDFDNVYIRKYDLKYEGLNLYLILDSHDDYEINELISYIKSNKISGVIFNNYRDLAFIDNFRSAGIKIRIGRYLNVFNSYTFNYYGRFAEKICSSVENSIENINANSTRLPVEALVYGRVELMTMRHCPFSVIKKCGLKGCPTCKFNKGELRSHDGDMMKVIRYNTYSKIYPENPSRASLNNFNNNVSLLYSIMNDRDLETIDSSKIRDSYAKGVI